MEAYSRDEGDASSAAATPTGAYGGRMLLFFWAEVLDVDSAHAARAVEKAAHRGAAPAYLPRRVPE